MNHLNSIILVCVIASAQISSATNVQQKHVAEFIEKYGDHDFEEFRGYGATQRGVSYTHLGEAVVVRVGRLDANLPGFPAFKVDTKTGKFVSGDFEMPCHTNGTPFLTPQEVEQYGRVAEKVWEYHFRSVSYNDKGVLNIILYDPASTSLTKLPSTMKPEDYFLGQPEPWLKRRNQGGWFWYEKLKKRKIQPGGPYRENAR